MHGLVRGQRPVTDVPDGIKLVRGDLLDQSSLVTAMREVLPDVVYHLAAIGDPGLSWREPTLVADVNGLGTLRLLETIRDVVPLANVVHASSAVMFGNYAQPATELTRFNPRTLYGVSKLYAHMVCVSYREAYNMNIATAIMYPHTSTRQDEGFIIPKVVRTAVRIAKAGSGELRLGDLATRRDWGWAPDFTRAWPMIAGTGEDYVLATGEDHSIEDLCQVAFEAVGLDWRDHVRSDAAFFRLADTTVQIGDPDKIKQELGWAPTLSFEDMIRTMMEASL